MGQSHRHDQPGASAQEDLLDLIANLDPRVRSRLRPGLVEAIATATRLRGAGSSPARIAAHLQTLASDLEQQDDERFIGHLLLQQRYQLFSMGHPDVERVVDIDRLVEWILSGSPRWTPDLAGTQTMRH
jgi:hypothetical protein